MSGLTPFQTIGPFFEVLLRTRVASRQTAAEASGNRITIEGVVRDGGGHPVVDALIEVWQADGQGRYDHPDGDGSSPDPQFFGYGWCETDEDGCFRFETVKPAAVPAPDGGRQAPHILVSVMARGILTRLITRAYFDDEDANTGDSILLLVPGERRQTLIARMVDTRTYRFDIRLQGSGETVFFDV
jgi:protocatechuate 3,4-dioxygenase alpha subunit